MPSTPSSLDRTQYAAWWLLEHFLRADVFARKREQLSHAIADKIAQPPAVPLRQIPRERDLSVREFIRRYRDPLVPVVLEGAAKSWPAYARWSPAFFAEHYPDCPVILFDATIEHAERDAAEPAEVTHLRDFIARMASGSQDYARFLPLLQQHPELMDDFDASWLRSAAHRWGGGMRYQFFMGGPQTSTSMHSALGANLFVQVSGRKQWWSYSTAYTPLLRPPMERSVFFRSQVSAEEPKGIFQKAQGWTTTLEPGDILYNPPFFWHQARNLEIAIGVGFRWYALSSMLRASPAQLLMTLTASNPSLRTVKKLQGNFARVYAEALQDSGDGGR